MTHAATRLVLRMPRALLDPLGRTWPAPDREGLVTVQLELREGRIAQLQPLEASAAAAAGDAAPLALSPLVDLHAHLDKTFSWSAYPNLAGQMAGALAANTAEAAERSQAQVLERAERALQRAWRQGLRAIRSHVDSGGPQEQPSWEALLQLRDRWRGRVELQLVALVPLATWATSAGAALARRVAAAGGLLGGVLGPPFPLGGAARAPLRRLLDLAEQLGCGVDLHIDEADGDPACGLKLLLAELERQPRQLAITCSHCCSMALLPLAAQRRLAERLAAQAVAVVALPSTNLWLLARRHGLARAQRPIAPLALLQQAGVAVAVAGDNVQDPWYPGGDYDPLDLMRLALPALQLAPWTRQGLMPFSSVPARLMNLAWDGVVRVGAPADLVVVAASSWSELLARTPQRRVLRAGRWLEPPQWQHVDPRLARLG